MLMKRLLCSAIAVALLLIGSGARANPVAPGGSVTPDIFADVSGTVLATYSGSYSAGSKLAGNFVEYVVRDAVTGTLDFVYQFKETGGVDSVGRITVDNYAGFTTDVGFASTLNLSLPAFGLGTIFPLTADRSGGTGDVVGFNYDKTAVTVLSTLVPGTVTMLTVIKTDAVDFKANDTSLIDGLTALASPTVGPAPAGGGLLAPLPSTAGLGLVLLGGLGFGRARRANLA